eukprot:gene402-1798_t
MALMELVMRGAADKYLRGLRTLWGPKQHQDGYTNSTHEIVEQVDRRPAIHAGSSQTKCCEWTVSRSGDMVGDFFLRFTSSQVYEIDDESLMYDAIESVEYKIGGEVIERYSGAALRMLATFDPRARPSFQRESGRYGGGDLMQPHVDAMEVVMPLRLCTSTGSTHNYLPLIRLRYHEVKVQVHFSRFVEDPRLFASYVLLDNDERRALCHTPQVDLRIFQKMSLSRVVTIDKGNGGLPHPTLIDLSRVDCQVRDLIVTIRDSNGQRSAREPLLGMRLLMGEGKHQRQMSMDGLMARRVIPRQYYGINIDHSPPPIYYMPFDHTPLLDDDCTGSLDFGRVAPVQLELKLVPGDTYKIDIMFRTLNMLKTQRGMGELRLSPIPNINMDGDGLLNEAATAPVQSPPPTPVQQAPGMDMDKVIMLNVSSAVIAEIRSSLVDAKIIYRTSEGAYRCDTRPALHAAPHGVLYQLQCIVNDGIRPLARVIGSHVSVGTTDDGMHEHRDESYQVEVENSVRAHEKFEGGGKRGGDDEVLTLLVYLADVEEGGETVFVSDDNLVEMRVKPRANKAVMFPSRSLHRVLPVKRGHKIVIAAEVKLVSF